MATPISAARPEHEITDNGNRRLAASDGLGTVTMCDCGTLSLNVQAMSLRLDMKAFAQLLLMCSEAMDVLEGIARRSANDESLKAACAVPGSPLIH